jgi:hypothetical protein
MNVGIGLSLSLRVIGRGFSENLPSARQREDFFVDTIIPWNPSAQEKKTRLAQRSNVLVEFITPCKREPIGISALN